MSAVVTHSFTAEGYLVLKQLISPTEISMIQQEADRVLTQERLSACVRPNNTLTPLRWNDRLVDLFLGSGERLKRLAVGTGGASLKWISAYISSKDPGTGPLWWHQDWWCWHHDQSFKKEATQVAVLCYLQPTTEDSGALRVIPGSHHRHIPLHEQLPRAHDHDLDLDSGHPAMADHPDQLTLNLEAGDAVVIDYRLLHGTHANIGANRRDCLMLTFTPDWDRLPSDIQGHLSRNFALPQPGESIEAISYDPGLLPDFDALAFDLEIDRVPPSYFTVSDS